MRAIKDITKWYFSKKALPYWGVLLLDCFFVIIAGLLAYQINHGAEETIEKLDTLIWTLGIFLVCFIVGFRTFHTYHGILRYSSFTDLLRVAFAVIVALVVIFVIQGSLSHTSLIAFTIADITLFGLFTAMFMWIMRVWVKTVYEDVLRQSPAKQKAFILGVSPDGVAIAKNINNSTNLPYKVAGFVTYQPELENRYLLGVKVHPFNPKLLDVMEKAAVSTIIVSPAMMDFIPTQADFIDDLAARGIKIMVFPNAKEWDGKSDLDATSLRPVNVEDLLPRDQIEVDMQAASDLLKDNVVMITGAAGSIGSEIVRQVAAYKPSHLILIDQAETPMHDIRLMMQNEYPQLKALTVVSDIADKRMMHRLFSQYRPQYVFHAAAYKHVPMMEDNPYQSIYNNVHGTKVIADYAVKFGAKKFVMVSTDKAVNPTNIMGCSKRICEIYVQSLDKAIKEGTINGQTQFVTTRFGNVLGSNGSVIPIFQKQISKGGPVTVTHPDIIRYFMLISEACKLVIQAGTMGKGGEIYVFDMGEPVKIVDLARRMITLSGAKDVEIKFTGLREGEKLYEEVLNDAEITVPTYHPLIKIAKVREYDYGEINDTISELIDTLDEKDDMAIVAEMKIIVTEFKSKNSKYEVLDK